MATVQKWFTGTSAPATTPSNVGDFFVDTTNSKAYIATGTSSSADWQPISLNLALPVDDSTSLVNDPADDTKQVRIDAGNITTGTVRVLTMTDADLDLANVLQNISEDTSPQLGGMLDVNGNSIGDGTLELLKFTETVSAVNEFTIANAATAGAPVLSATGDDANIGITLTPKGTGNITLGTMAFDSDQTIGAGQDNYVLTYDNGTGLISLEAVAAAGLSNVVEDTTPQLGGMLDVNGNSIGDGTLELLKFTETVSAVNEFTITNAATAGAPDLSATGDDANISITFTPKGTGTINPKKAVQFTQGSDVASGAALGVTNGGNFYDVTGTTSITSINSVGIGTFITLQFDGALTLTHHATDLILPGAANITTAAGDIAQFYEYASGDWRCTNYQVAATAPGGGGGAGGGILPTTDTDKTTDYTIVSGDIGDRIYLTSSATADSKFTLDVSLFADSGEAISFCNESSYKLTIEVSNTGTMTFNNNVTTLVIWKGDPVLTVGGDTSTNANVIAGG